MPIDEDLLINSERRLWAMIERRTETGADTDEIDKRIWELFGERWAVMFTDLEGFSRKTRDFGILHFLQVILESKKLLLPVVHEHGGLLLKADGDSMFLLFRTPRRAVECAVEMQRACQMASSRMVDEEQILLCIGIGYGEVLRVGEHECWGREVNAASKLGEDTAEPHQIFVTESVANAVGESVDGVSFRLIGDTAAGAKRNHEIVYDHYQEAPPAG